MTRPETRASLTVPALIAAAAIYLLVTFHYRGVIGPYMVDDAYIFFRYADNFARGEGLVYNPGDPVEGYTSFLWTVGLGLAARAGLPLIATAQFVGIGLGLVTLLLTWRIGAHLFPGSRLALLPPLFLATNRTYCVWSVEGLETKLFGAALAATLLAWLRWGSGGPARGRVPLLGILAAATVLARPEGAAFVGLLGIVALRFGGRGRDAAGALRNAAAFLGITGLHLAFRWVTYHDVLPNTFYAKITGVQIDPGLRYLAALVQWNRLLWYAPLTLIGAVVFLRRSAGPFPGPRIWIVTSTVFFLAYLVLIGGDFFEFRFFDPLLPAWAFLTVAGVRWTLARLPHAVPARVVPSLLVTLWLGANALTVARPVEGRLTRMTTAEWAVPHTRDFFRAGRWLARNLEPGDVIAVKPAGVIAFLTRAKVVDMLGLNDREIARRPDFVVEEGAAGHQRRLPPGYLAQRGVTYVVGHPRVNASSTTPAPRWISAEIEPGLFFHMLRLSESASLAPGVHRLGEHAGSLEGWEPVPR